MEMSIANLPLFCEEHFIISLYFLHHTTHLCQPLDGQKFQCLKLYLRKENSEVVMWGGSVSKKKRDFFRVIRGVRE